MVASANGDINLLRHQGQVLGPRASAPMVWRVLDALTPTALKRIERDRAKVRRHVWSQLPKLPASAVADTDLGQGRGSGCLRPGSASRGVLIPPDRFRDDHNSPELKKANQAPH